MARKFVSGVLAFAMVFGATAPVVFAEPVATEVVDQEAVYAPSLAATSVKLAKTGDTATVLVNDVAADAKATIVGGSSTVKISLKDSKLTVEALKDIAADETIKIEFTSENGIYQNTVELKIEKGTVAYSISVDPMDIHYKLDDPLAVGKSVSFVIKGTDGTDGGAPTVAATLNDTAKKYFTVTTANNIDTATNKVNGTKVTLTAVTAMTADEILGMATGTLMPQLRIAATYGDAKFNKTYYLGMTVKNSDIVPISIALTANATTVAAGAPINFAAKVTVSDGFGGTTTDDEADVTWYVNGNKVPDNGIITNALGNTIAQVVKDASGYTAMKFTANVAGTYRISVATADGDLTAAKTITVTSAVALDTGDPWLYTSDSDMNKYDNKVAKPAKAGGTVDLTNVKFAAWGKDGKGYPVATFNGVATLEAKDVVVKGTSYGANVAKKIVTIKDGVVTIADASNSVMAELLQAAGDKEITISLTGKVKFSTTDTREMYEKNSITITVAKASDKYNETIFTIAGKAFDGIPVMTVGDTVKVDAKVVDINKFTDGLDQRVIWSIRNAKDDNNVYATVDANGTVTALKKCLGTAELVAVPVANTNIEYSWKLFIMDSTATAAPTVTPAPTATAAPTTAPATKTGKVTASSLRVRETPVNGTVIGKLAKGTAVTILETKDGWYKVTAGSLTGWVSGEYVELTTPSTTETAKTTANLKLRKTAKTGSVITTMPKGSKVEVLEKGSEWSKVKYHGKTGYASNAYLEFEEDAVG